MNKLRMKNEVMKMKEMKTTEIHGLIFSVSP
jgi:hypothetical protein